MSKLFPINQHPIERAIRVSMGLGLLAIAFVGPRTPWGFLGIVLIVTGAVGTCPLYTIFGFSTCPEKAH